jgi:WD40 repeat protein
MKENHISWVTTGQLAITSGEMNIRIWNLKNDDNYVLNYEQGDKPTSEFITCISYSSAKGILSAGTNSGYIVMWQCLTAAAATNGTDAAGDMGEESWKCLPRVHIGNAIRNMHWGGGSSHVLALNTIRQVFFLSEQTRALHFNNGVSAIQTSPNDLAINFYNSESPIKINSPVPVEKIFLTDGNVFIYGTGTPADGKESLLLANAISLCHPSVCHLLIRPEALNP